MSEGVLAEGTWSPAAPLPAPQVPHVKVGPEETPTLPYLRFASVTLHPSNADLSLAIGSILRSFGYPTTSIICAKAECELPVSPGLSFHLQKPLPVLNTFVAFWAWSAWTRPRLSQPSVGY